MLKTITVHCSDTNPCNGLDVCCVETETMDKNLGSTNETAHADKPSNTISCGQKNEGIDDRISGGTSAKFVEFPWMVAILESKPSNPSSPNYVSGGSLIHPRVVLTAYHRINRYQLVSYSLFLNRYELQPKNLPTISLLFVYQSNQK